MLKENQTVYGLVRSVTKSGNSRKISFYVVEELSDGSLAMRNITNYVSSILNKKVVVDAFGRGCIKITGSGMDMVFHTVNDLSKRLNLKFRHDYL